MNPGLSESSSNHEIPISRFESLMARFFDGQLDESEDMELVAFLESNPVYARQFLSQARTERLLAGLSDECRLTDPEFAARVATSLNVDRDTVGTAKFAADIVKLVNAGVKQRASRRPQRVRPSAPKSTPWIYIGAAAAAVVAVVALIVIATSNNSNSSVARTPAAPSNSSSSTSTPTNLEVASKRGTKKSRRDDRVVATASKDQPSDDEAILELESFDPFADDGETPPPPSVPLAIPLPEVAMPEPVVPAIENGPRARVAGISRISGTVAQWQRAGGQDVAPARAGELGYEGDILRIVDVAMSPSELPPMPLGAEVILNDGSALWLTPGTSIALITENESPRLTLETGTLTARVRPQVEGKTLRIRTRQGAETTVIGTTFRLTAAPESKKVSLEVEEGKVSFKSQGIERFVKANQACVAVDGKAPTVPYDYRPSPATLNGMVTDKTTGEPMANTTVTAIPMARRKDARAWPTVKTDTLGQFKFEALAEGAHMIVAQTETGGSHGLTGRASMTRLALAGGEEKKIVVQLDKAIIVTGRLLDGTGTGIKDAKVRFSSAQGDGRNTTLGLKQYKLGLNEYYYVALEGAGNYRASVEKPGMLARIVPSQLRELRPDRPNHWPLEVIMVPSATIRGRVLNAAAQPYRDTPGDNPYDPRSIRTVVTLTASDRVETVLAEADGSYAFNTNIETGNYTVKAERFGMLPTTRKLFIHAGQTADMDLTLDRAAPIKPSAPIVP